TGRDLGGPKRGWWRSAFAFSPDGKTVAIGDGNTVILWDPANWQERAVRGHSRGVYSLAYSSDSRFVASRSGDETICIWEALTGRPIGQHLAPEHFYCPVWFGKDARFYALASQEKHAVWWDVVKEQELQTFPPSGSWKKEYQLTDLSQDQQLVVAGGK